MYPAFFRFFRSALIGLLLCIACRVSAVAQQHAVVLVAHRGGVVGAESTENGLPALEKARQAGYSMVEIDLRVTADGVLIANHDADYRRFYGMDKKVVQTTWQDARQLKSTLDGASPLRAEDVFSYCHANGLGVMLDNKIAGLDTVLFNNLLTLLDRYSLRNAALMIGTDESTEFFTGKIRLSCSRSQLEHNMQKPGYRAADYFFFERPARLTQDDVTWARDHDILLVAAVNKFHYSKAPDMQAEARKDCQRMLEYGVTHFQIDSEFGSFFGH